MPDSPYGLELIIDLFDCNRLDRFNRSGIEKFLDQLCALIGMVRAELHFWDYLDDPEGYAAAPAHLKGTSAVQFIMTSSIVVHTLDDLHRVYLNIFSCHPFDAVRALTFSESYFGGSAKHCQEVTRL